MMWGKRKPIAKGDERLRCPMEVKRGNQFEKCMRLARTWSVSHRNMEFGGVICCQAHADVLREKGFVVTAVDLRRKKVSK